MKRLDAKYGFYFGVNHFAEERDKHFNATSFTEYACFKFSQLFQHCNGELMGETMGKAPEGTIGDDTISKAASKALTLPIPLQYVAIERLLLVFESLKKRFAEEDMVVHVLTY